MAIASEISRLQTAKANIKTSIENKGVTVPSSTTLSGYSALIDSIPTGGGAEVVTGSFTATSSGSKTIDTGYSGDGNIISFHIFLTDASMSAVDGVAIYRGITCMTATARYLSSPPDYTTSTYKGNNGDFLYAYKNSKTSGGSLAYAYSGSAPDPTLVFYNLNAEAYFPIRIKDKTTVSLYARSNDFGFITNQEYNWIAVYA